MSVEKEQINAFLDMLRAAMLDAAIERKMTQLKTTITPPGRAKAELIRIIIVPETMDREFGQPLRRKG